MPTSDPKARHAALAGLRHLDAEDFPRYRAAMEKASPLAWQCFFPFLYFWSRDSRDRLLVDEDESSVCLFCIRSSGEGDRLDLFFPPLPFDAVSLNRCLARIRAYNGERKAYVRWVDEELIGHFSGHHGVGISLRSRQYLYDPKRYRDLSGGGARNLRRNLMKIEDRGDVQTRPYRPVDRDTCLGLLDRWAALQDGKYEHVSYQGYTRQCLAGAHLFAEPDLIGRVVSIAGEIRAFGFGGQVHPGMGNLFITYSDLEEAGLNQYLNWKLLQAMEPLERVNSGMADTPGLVFAKEALLPVGRLALYRVDFSPGLAVPAWPVRQGANPLDEVGPVSGIPVRLLTTQYFAGPSIVGTRPCTRVVLALSPLPRGQWEAVCRRLGTLVGALLRRDPGQIGLVPAPPAELWAEGVMALQRHAGYPVYWSRVASAGPGCWEIAFETARPDTHAALLDCMNQLMTFAIGGVDQPPEALRGMRAVLRARLRDLYRHERQQTAARLSVPFRRAFRDGGLNLLGQGASTQIASPAYTQRTSRLAWEVAGDKEYTHATLARSGLPIPAQRVVHDVDEALSAAAAIGYPVVVKPLHSNQGRGAMVNLMSDAAVREAYVHAREINRRTLVEKYLPGLDFRLLVVGGRFAAAACRMPPEITGDGVHSIGELVGLANLGAERDGPFLDPIKLDAEALSTLAEQGLEPDSVPGKGKRIELRRVATPQSWIVDVSDQVHPDNRELAEAAARACGLDVAGIDLMSMDIGRSWRENGAAIIEVNAGPGIDMHLFPTRGKPRGVSWRLLRSSYRATDSARIPVVMVSGRYRKGVTVKHAARLLGLAGYWTGACLRDEAYVAGMPLADAEPQSRFPDFLSRADLQACVAEISTVTLARAGLPVERIAVAVLTDASWSADSLADELVAPGLAERVYRMMVDSATDGVVIDANHEALRLAVSHRPAWQVCHVWTGEPDAAAMAGHLEAGGRSLVLEVEGGETWVCQRRGRSRLPLLPLAALTSEQEGDDPRPALLAMGTLLIMGRMPPGTGFLRAALVGPESNVLTSLVGGWRVVGAPWLAADPRDRHGARQWPPMGEGFAPWVVLLDAETPESVAPGAWSDALRQQAARWYCLGAQGEAAAAELRRLMVPEGEICVLADWLWAVERIQAGGHPGGMLFLSENAAERRRFLDALPSSPGEAADGVLWSADDLAETFAGQWVNGPGQGWGVCRVSWSRAHGKKNELVIVNGAPDDPAEAPELERRILAAFSAGASAVVAPLVPDDLPRWRSVLVCDRPALGLERLGRKARQRSRARWITLAPESVDLLKPLGKAWRQALGRNPRVLLADEDQAECPPDPVLATALHLVNETGDPGIVLACAPADPDALSLLNPTLWAGGLGALPATTVPAWLPGMGIVLAVAAADAPSWEATLRERAIAVHALLEHGCLRPLLIQPLASGWDRSEGLDMEGLARLLDALAEQLPKSPLPRDNTELP